MRAEGYDGAGWQEGEARASLYCLSTHKRRAKRHRWQRGGTLRILESKLSIKSVFFSKSLMQKK